MATREKNNWIVPVALLVGFVLLIKKSNTPPPTQQPAPMQPALPTPEPQLQLTQPTIPGADTTATTSSTVTDNYDGSLVKPAYDPVFDGGIEQTDTTLTAQTY